VRHPAQSVEADDGSTARLAVVPLSGGKLRTAARGVIARSGGLTSVRRAAFPIIGAVETEVRTGGGSFGVGAIWYFFLLTAEVEDSSTLSSRTLTAA